MVICADTSFLFSLYGNDSHTSKATAWCMRNTHSITISALNRFELINALRFAEGRKFIQSGSAALYQQLFIDAISANRLMEQPCNLAEVLAESHRLSSAHTLTGGHRSFDILHVAAARIMGATHFLTFDGNQRRLAQAEGFLVPL